MKKCLVKLAVVSLVSLSAPVYAEVLTVETKNVESNENAPAPQVQNYTQLCLVNQTGRTVLLDSSWDALYPVYRTQLRPNATVLYRFEATGVITKGDGDIIHPVLKVRNFGVGMRTRGLPIVSGRQSVQVPMSYEKTDDCDVLPTYAVMIGAAEYSRRGELLLVPAHNPRN
jgi:hypothetical protein